MFGLNFLYLLGSTPSTPYPWAFGLSVTISFFKGKNIEEFFVFLAQTLSVMDSGSSHTIRKNKMADKKGGGSFLSMRFSSTLSKTV